VAECVVPRVPHPSEETIRLTTDTPNSETHMPLSNEYVIGELLVRAGAMFFLVWSVVGAAVGAGLVASGAKTLRLFGIMNHFVSTRHLLKPLTVGRDVGQSVLRHRRLIGALVVLGAVYSIYGLVARFDNPALVAALDLRYPRSFVAWILESARWSLILLSVFACVIGVMLGFYRDALGRLEARANRWYSTRKFTRGADTMDLTLDKWVEAFPRSAGSIIMVTALYVAANAAIVWLRFA